MLPSEWMFCFGITYVHWNVQDKSRIGMEEKRIFDLVLVKFGRFLVNCGHILVKSGYFLVFFGIDVNKIKEKNELELALTNPSVGIDRMDDCLAMYHKKFDAHCISFVSAQCLG